MDTVMPIKKVEDCSACGACFAVCPVDAIRMETDDYGCLYPRIDDAVCIKCGRCVGVCTYHAPISAGEPMEAYAAVGEQLELVKNSASGGIFATLAQNCICNAGMVVGAVMDMQHGQADVYHVLSDKMTDISRMQGSKYVQSQAWRCYADVQEAVKAGRTVLFSGTPCQVAAVKQLTGNPANLVTIDLICHGVPPMQMLNDYLKILGKRFGGTITQFQFRDKFCKKQYCAKLELQKKEKKHTIWLRSHFLSFYKYFLDGSIQRENCYACPYASLRRISDITIGDYWGVEKYHGEQISSGQMPERKDWSCVLVNTQKGKRFLETHQDNLILFPTKALWVAENNRQLNAPSSKTAKREAIFRNYARGGYAAVETAFIRECGGKLRYYWRMLKNPPSNRK